MTTVNLDQPYKLRLTAGAFRRFQSSVSSGVSDMSAISRLILDSLKSHHPDITEEALEELLDAESLRLLWNGVQEELKAFSNALNPTTASEAQTSTGSENAPLPALN